MTSSLPPQTLTEFDLVSLPDKTALLRAFKGKRLAELRSPALVIDRDAVRENCERVTLAAKDRGMRFRAHVKTHKTIEATRMQVEAGGGVRALIASTMIEVWGIIRGGLVQEGLVDDILYSMPVCPSKLADLHAAQQAVGGNAVIRVMVDHPAQVEALGRFSAGAGRTQPWSAFIKVDGGGRRAGVPPTSPQMHDLVRACLASSHVEIYGFYSHFGQSYASTDLDTATGYYQGEIGCVNAAAKVARGLGARGEWVLSVGATPTAHAATQVTHSEEGGLEGVLELHAGNYCLLDLQQLATSLISPTSCALTVLSRVVSVYPHRNEAMCDAGALAVSKDTGPLPGYGHVVEPEHLRGWNLGRISQEHGTLVHRHDLQGAEEGIGEVQVGDLLRIVPQHACLVCAGHPWVYVVSNGGDEVVDVWVPWKGW